MIPASNVLSLQVALQQLTYSLCLPVLCCCPAGKSERSILHKLKLLSSKLGSMLARGRASAGGVASGLAHNRESGRSLEAPTSPALAPPTCPPVQQQQSPATDQHALGAASNRARTVPNILSRSRKQAPLPTGEGGPRHSGNSH